MDTIFNDIGSIVISTSRMSIPLILAALGSIYCERSGIISLVLEGMMLAGAFTAVVGSYLFANAFVGVIFGMLGGLLIAVFHSLLTIKFKVNQVISGIGLNLLVSAVTILLMQAIWGSRGNSPQVVGVGKFGDSLNGIPLIGNFLGEQSIFTVITIILVIISGVVIFKTKFGLRLRMVGENPTAGSTLGLRVNGIKYWGVLVCGLLAGLAGAYLSLDHLNIFVREMTAGRGFIAYVIAIFGRYNPFGVVVCALIFGLFDAIQINLQGNGIPSQIYQMMPYIITLLVITFAVKRIRQPKGLGEDISEQ